MPTDAKYRRTWFALVRAAGIDDEDRHWVQESLTGKASTSNWNRRDWETAIASLQRDLGQHHDHAAHVREDQAKRLAEPGAGATGRQVRFLEELCNKIAWNRGPDLGPIMYVCRHFLPGPENADRRRQFVDAREFGRWRMFTRKKASGLVKAFEKMIRYYPAEEDKA